MVGIVLISLFPLISCVIVQKRNHELYCGIAQYMGHFSLCTALGLHSVLT